MSVSRLLGRTFSAAAKSESSASNVALSSAYGRGSEAIGIWKGWDYYPNETQIHIHIHEPAHTHIHIHTDPYTRPNITIHDTYRKYPDFYCGESRVESIR